MTNLLNEKPVIVIPRLATVFGTNGAVILLLLHKRIREEGKRFNEKQWYNQSYDSWKMQLPFIRTSAIKRQLLTFQQLAIVEATDEFNVLCIDRTKWYTINYETLQSLTGITEKDMNHYLTPNL